MSTTTPESTYKPPADLKSRLANSYDLLAPRYNTWAIAHTDLRLKWVNKLLALLPSSGTESQETTNGETSLRILELGAGAGLPTTKLLLDHNPGTKVVANDISPVQINALHANLNAPSYKGRLATETGDMLALDFPDASFGAVVAMYSIIHLPRDEQTILLRKIAGWLKPGGLLLANFAETAAEEHVMEDWLGEKGAWTYWSGWGVDTTLAKVEETGLEVFEKDVEGEAVDSDFLWILARKA